MFVQQKLQVDNFGNPSRKGIILLYNLFKDMISEMIRENNFLVLQNQYDLRKISVLSTRIL